MNAQNKKLKEIVIGIGSNINPETNIPNALKLLAGYLSVIKISSIWQTSAVGSAGPDFLNAAVLTKSDLPLEEIKTRVLSQIESDLGRIRTENKYADRTIDLDVVLFNGKCLDPELWTQAHVAIPVAELLPDLINPQTNEKLGQAAERFQKQFNFNTISGLL